MAFGFITFIRTRQMNEWDHWRRESARRESNYVGGWAAKLMWIKTCNFQLLSSWFCAWTWCFDLWRHTTGVAKSDRFMKCAGDNGAYGIKHVTRINPFLHSHPLYSFMRFTFLNINPPISTCSPVTEKLGRAKIWIDFGFKLCSCLNRLKLQLKKNPKI